MSEREYFVRTEAGLGPVMDAVREMIATDQVVAVIVRPWEAKGSPRDHRHYRALLALIAQNVVAEYVDPETGEVVVLGKRPKQWWHAFLKLKFLHPVDRPGLTSEVPSLADLKRAELRNFRMHVEAYAAEQGVYLPDRNYQEG